MSTPDPLLTLGDYEAQAKKSMPTALFERLSGAHGSPDADQNVANMAAFNAVKLRPRVLKGIGQPDPSLEVLGQRISFPVALAPSGGHQRAHPQGELATARAAGASGTIMALATRSTYSIEEVAEVALGPLWFQLYFFRNRELSKVLVERAELAGYTALVLTVDLLGSGSNTGERRQKLRHGTSSEANRVLKNLAGINLPNVPTLENFSESVELAVGWSDVEWLRSITSMPLVIKGIQTAEDARLCAEYGVDALIVSNHGGNTVPGTLGTIEMLPEIVDAVGNQVEVYLDSGIRRGVDVLKALALGAKATFIGRPIFWGLWVDGESGVRGVLEILRDELVQAMGFCGVATIQDVDQRLVMQTGGWRPDDVVGQLERLASLVGQGYLTRGEFEAQKAKLLRK